jgi:hypothetical protein
MSGRRPLGIAAGAAAGAGAEAAEDVLLGPTARRIGDGGGGGVQTGAGMMVCDGGSGWTGAGRRSWSNSLVA